MTFADLLALHNQLALKPAGPKTFASRARMIERIRKLAADKNIDLASFGQPAEPEVTEQRAEPQADTVEAADATETKRPRGHGVGELARRLLMDGSGLPHAVIASMVNAEIPGAAATAKSVRWYACKMRKQGVTVPERQKVAEQESSR
ncbi:hypothetical protein LT17_01589 [Pseudomonas aeruginosa]|nr:hypothetical protein LT17_01589 [Pseudomonas aeruginosa]